MRCKSFFFDYNDSLLLVIEVPKFVLLSSIVCVSVCVCVCGFCFFKKEDIVVRELLSVQKKKIKKFFIFFNFV